MFGWLQKKFGIPRPTAAGMRTFALMLVAPIFAGLLGWQLYGLEPERICVTTFDLARMDGVGYLDAFKACFSLYSKALDIKDHAIIGLMVILGLGYLMMLMRELRMQGEINGPLGWGAKFHDSGLSEKPGTPADGAKLAGEAVEGVVEQLEGER